MPDNIDNLGGVIDGPKYIPNQRSIPSSPTTANRPLSFDELFEQGTNIRPSAVETIPLSSIYQGDRYASSRPGEDLEEMYAQQQSVPSKWMNAAVKMAGTFSASYLGGTAGLVYGAVEALTTGRLAAIADNEVNRKADAVNKYLEDARISKLPIRFWFKPSKGRIVFKNWAVVADRTTIFENDQEDNSAERILWFLAEVGSPYAQDWPDEVANFEVLDLPEEEKPISRSPEKLLARYSQLSEILSQEASESVVSQKTRRTFKRRKDARDLVLARSGDKCENTWCTGMPRDTDKHGRALLEVDHIKPLGEGGPDVPSNMIALCPNCHVAKTRGINAAAMSKELKKIVEAREMELLRN